MTLRDSSPDIAAREEAYVLREIGEFYCRWMKCTRVHTTIFLLSIYLEGALD